MTDTDEIRSTLNELIELKNSRPFDCPHRTHGHHQCAVRSPALAFVRGGIHPRAKWRARSAR